MVQRSALLVTRGNYSKFRGTVLSGVKACVDMLIDSYADAYGVYLEALQRSEV